MLSNNISCSLVFINATHHSQMDFQFNVCSSSLHKYISCPIVPIFHALTFTLECNLLVTRKITTVLNEATTFTLKHKSLSYLYESCSLPHLSWVRWHYFLVLLASPHLFFKCSTHKILSLVIP